LCAERLTSDVDRDSVDFLHVLEGLAEGTSARLDVALLELRGQLPLGHAAVDSVRDADMHLGALVALTFQEFATESASEFLIIARALLARTASLIAVAVDQLSAVATVREVA